MYTGDDGSEERAVYSGTFWNGIPHGIGYYNVETIPEEGKNFSNIYWGEWRNGES